MYGELSIYKINYKFSALTVFDASAPSWVTGPGMLPKAALKWKLMLGIIALLISL